MTELLITYAQFQGASALLVAFYWVALRHRASYKLSRLYLIGVPMLSAMMCGLKFEVEVPAMPFLTETEAMTSKITPALIINEPQYNSITETVSAPESSSAIEVPMIKEPQAEKSQVNIDYAAIIRIIVPLISVILLLIAAFHIIKLLCIKQKLHAETTAEGYELIHSSAVQTPFSFGKTIFLPEGLDADRESYIVCHEKAHITHGHYIDVWIAEILARMFWFNPFVWYCRSELSNIHEFEADHDVIVSGADILAYQTTLLEMVMSESIPLVSGFNHSFIRQRFIEMKKSTVNTLGRLGKLGTAVWVIALVCLFTISCKSEKNNMFIIPELNEPQLFILEGSVDPQITDSCYNIYLSDEYFHIEGEVPDTCVQVVDGKFHYELPLTKTIAGRVRCIFPGGELCSAWIDLWFVPGETLHLSVHNGYYETDHPFSHETKAARAMFGVRHANDMKDPHMPVVTAPQVWDKPSIQVNGYCHLSVERVYFGQDETVVLFTTNEATRNVSIPGNIALRDKDGQLFKLKRTLNHPVDDNWSQEQRTFGVYCAFEPMVDSVDTFYVINNVSDNTPQEMLTVSQDNTDSTNPNFTLRIITPPDIDLSGYLIRQWYYDSYSDGEMVADLTIGKNRECTFTRHLDREYEGNCIAVSPDGSVNTFNVSFPFVPGETAELRVYDGNYHLSGTGFYSEWAKADEACENAMKCNTREEAREQQLAYLRQHANEDGCVAYYEWKNIVGIKDLYESLPESIKNSSHGQRLKKQYDNWVKIMGQPYYVVKMGDKIFEGVVFDDGDPTEMLGDRLISMEIFAPDNLPEKYQQYGNARLNGVKILTIAQ